MPFKEVGSNNGLSVASFRNVPPKPRSSPHRQPETPFANLGEDKFPLVTDPSGVYSAFITDSDMTLNKQKFVKVSSVGEVEVSPDRVEFCVQIVSSKADLAAARESVRKRDEFVMLALKKLGIPEKNVSTTNMVKRYKLRDEAEDDDNVLEIKILRDVEKQMAKGKRGNNHENENGLPDPLLDAERIKVIKELYVVCNGINQYMELFSIVNEKLDHQVNVSPPVIRITPECLQRHTQAAARLAFSNAMNKANEMLQAQKGVRGTVGKLFYSVEDSLTIHDISEYQNIATSIPFESLRWKKNNKLIICKLTSLFEVTSARAKRVI